MGDWRWKSPPGYIPTSRRDSATPSVRTEHNPETTDTSSSVPIVADQYLHYGMKRWLIPIILRTTAGATFKVALNDDSLSQE
jgi:hypothetical protein